MNNNIFRDAVRDDNGKFSVAYDAPKTLRSIRLTDTAWQSLGELADTLNTSRTDIIEQWARDKETPQEIILKAINQFIEDKRQEYGSNPAQKGEFKYSRSWDYLLQFKSLIENAPWELLGENQEL